MLKKDVQTQIEKLNNKVEDCRNKISALNSLYDEKIENYKNKMIEEKISKITPIEDNIASLQAELAKYEKALKIFEKQELDLAKIFED